MAPPPSDTSLEQAVKRPIKLPSLNGSEAEMATNTSVEDTGATAVGRPAISKTKISKSSCATSGTKTALSEGERKWGSGCGPPRSSPVQRKTLLRRRSGNFSLPVCYKVRPCFVGTRTSRFKEQRSWNSHIVRVDNIAQCFTTSQKGANIQHHVSILHEGGKKCRMKTTTGCF